MKKVIGILLIGFTVLSVLFVAASGTYLPKRYDSGDDVYDDEDSVMTESQFRLIQGGLRASSSHNMQPWKIHIVDETTFELHADLDKTLSVIDPDHRQLLLSQGTFLECLQETADQFGMMVSIDPSEIDLATGQTKIATVMIDNEITSDDWTLAGASKVDATDQSMAFSIEAAETLLLGSDHIRRTWIDGDQKATFQDLLLEATKLEAEDIDAMEELLSVFRWTRYEKNEYRYGLSLNTMSPLMQTFLEPILKLTSNPLSFGQSSIPPFQTRLSTEHTYLILSMNQPSSWDYVELGRWIQRIANRFRDVTVRPAVQLLEPLVGMDVLYETMISDYSISATPMIILGFQPLQEGFHESIRHRVSDLIQ